MNGWKVTAIIFIILFIAETLLFGFILKIGFDDLQKEEKCAIEICNDYDSYTYYSNVCSCFSEGEMQLTKYID